MFGVGHDKQTEVLQEQHLGLGLFELPSCINLKCTLTLLPLEVFPCVFMIYLDPEHLHLDPAYLRQLNTILQRYGFQSHPSHTIFFRKVCIYTTTRAPPVLHEVFPRLGSLKNLVRRQTSIG